MSRLMLNNNSFINKIHQINVLNKITKIPKFKYVLKYRLVKVLEIDDGFKCCLTNLSHCPFQSCLLILTPHHKK